MSFHENFDVEYKEIYIPNIKKEIIAFANTEGGTLYIGISDNGTIVGIQNTDDVMLQAANAIKDSIKPDIMPFVQIKAIEQESKSIIKITVSPGTNKPYYLQEKGLKPSGVYVRKGSSSQPLSDDGIREMIIQNSGKSYEKERSLNQDLTFKSFHAEMERRSLQIGASQMRTLHMIGEDGLYTNLALLLSDQCEHTIKVAIFQGKDKTIFRDRKEFSGSLLQQLHDVYELIELYNKTQATFSGLIRIDSRDYPEEAVREALLNSIVHRDYSFSGSTLVNLYDDRIEFVSLGGLIPGLSIEAIFMGVSQSRNPNLASIFYRMRLIESYGTGIGKIQRLYCDNNNQPNFETAQGVFRATLPNINEIPCPSGNIVSEEALPLVIPEKKAETAKQKELILSYAFENGYILRKDAEELLDIKTTRAFKLLKELCEDGKLVKQGDGKLARYIPTNN